MRTDPSNWSLIYDDNRSPSRFLLSMPSDMLRDMRLLAAAREVSLAELMRRISTQALTDFLAERPDLRASFRGRTLTADEELDLMVQQGD